MIMMCPVLSKIITDLNNQTYLFQEVCHGNSCQWWIEDIDDVNNSNCTFTINHHWGLNPDLYFWKAESLNLLMLFIDSCNITA
jgi:hypothetical protein